MFELIPSFGLMFDNDPDVPHERIWLKQDGAPPHFDINARSYLNLIFPNRWIGRVGPVTWPPRSIDMNPLDLFL